MLCVQIIHDFTFYFTVIRNSTLGQNAVMDELISYSKSVGTGAVIGDSFMYLMATPLLYILLKLNTEENTLISLLCTYILGYILYQKPIV